MIKKHKENLLKLADYLETPPVMPVRAIELYEEGFGK